MTMTESTADNVIDLTCRLRNGRAVETQEDLQQWFYEYLDRLSQEWGRDGNTPAEIFPAMVRVMVEWIEATHGISAESDLENARALAAAVSDLTGCLRKCLTSTAVQHEEKPT
jgi:hypothetical protein